MIGLPQPRVLRMPTDLPSVPQRRAGAASGDVHAWRILLAISGSAIVIVLACLAASPGSRASKAFLAYGRALAALDGGGWGLDEDQRRPDYGGQAIALHMPARPHGGSRPPMK
jgi:hypothetical protein